MEKSFEKENGDKLCGFACFKPQFLQRFRKIYYYVFFLSLFSVFQGMLVNGLISASIPHIEREFGISSTESGIILASNDVSGLLFVLIISYYGEDGHKPKFLGYGSILTGIGMFVFSLPKFIKGTYIPVGSTLHFKDFDTCQMNRSVIETTSLSCTKESSKLYLAIFCIGNILAGIGTAPLYTLGATYLDENVTPKKSPLYIGLWFATTLLGPSAGLFLSGKFSKTWVDFDEKLAVSLNSPLWVGRWWLPFATLSWGLLIVGAFLLLFPKVMPNIQKIRERAMAEGEIQKKSAKLEDMKKMGMTGFVKSCLNLVTNKFLVITIIGATAKVFIATGIGPFYAKFLILKFGVDPSKASVALGSVVATASTLGLLLGSIIMNRIKVKNSVKFAIRFCVVFTFIGSITSSYFAIPGCNTVQLMGINYNNNDRLWSCEKSCNCLDTYYNPICHDGITYYSPCYAGCTTFDSSTKTYNGCSCTKGGIGSNNTRKMVKMGRCDQSCKNMIAFLALSGLNIFISFMAGTPNNMIVLRSVPENQKSFAMGLNFLLQRALGMLPAPVIVGKIIDNTCLVWKYDECGVKTNCAEYDLTNLSNAILIFMEACSVISFLCYLIGYFIYTPLEEEKTNQIQGKLNEGLEKDESV